MEGQYTVTKYGAEWCHGCKVMDKIMSKVLEDTSISGKFKYSVVDIEEMDKEARDKITGEYGKSIPLLIVTDATGTVVAHQSGAKSIGVTTTFLTGLG